jgi:4-hydroxy-2-oxoheptanedioate aldolase
MCEMLIVVSTIHAVHHHSEGKSLVIVRVPKHDEISLTTALDAGAAGIIIPHCESAQEVKDMIKESFYGNPSFPVITFVAYRNRPNRCTLIQPMDFHTRPCKVIVP